MASGAYDLIGQRTYACDLDVHDVAVDKVLRVTICTHPQDVAGLQCHVSRDRNQIVNNSE